MTPQLKILGSGLRSIWQYGDLSFGKDFSISYLPTLAELKIKTCLTLNISI